MNPTILKKALPSSNRSHWLRGALAAFAITSLTPAAFADYSVDFEGAGETKTGYASATVSLSGIDWNMTEALIGTLTNDWKNGLRSARLRGYGTSSMTMLVDKPGGAGTISFSYRRYGTDDQVPWQVDYSTNGGGSWTQVGSTFTAPATDVVQTFSENVEIAGNIRFRIRQDGSAAATNSRLNIDDILITNFGVFELDITSRIPNPGSFGVSVNTDLALTFNQPVQAGLGNVILYQGASVIQTFAASSGSYIDNTVSFTPSASLDESTSYHVIVEATAFEDLSGNPFAGLLTNADWAFTTEDPDTTGPVPTAFVPATGASNLPKDLSVLNITFDETINLIGFPFIELRKTTGNELILGIDDNSAGIIANGNELSITLFSPLSLDYDTNYYVSVPAGTVEDSVGNDNLAFGAPLSDIPWTFTTALEPTPPTVVVNKYSNSGTAVNDVVELLVVGNETPGSTLDMRGMILKDFSSGMANDGGGKYEFNATALWQNVPVGTLIVVRSGISDSPDTDAADFKIEAGLNDTTLFTQLGTGTFDIAATDMVLIKAAGSGEAGVTGGIHALAAGAVGAQFTAFTGPKLIATATTNTNLGVVANNSNNVLVDYNGTDATGGLAVGTLSFGAANTPGNAIYITQLRGLILGDGDGVVTLANVTAASPLTGTPVFGSGLSGQSVELTLNATIPSVSLATVSIQVPTDFGAPGGITLSGPAGASAGSSITGQTVTITNAAATTTDALVITITGLTAPVPAAGDYGDRSFAVTTSVSGGTPAAIGSNPTALVTIPIATLRETNANGVSLALGKQVAVEGVNTEENFGTTNIQANIQDNTAGVALFRNVNELSPFVRGNRFVVYGPVGQFNGLTQVNYTGFVNLGADTEPAPLVLTVPDLLAAAETYEGSLVTLENLSYVSGTWAANQTVVLKDASNNNINIRIQGGSTATTAPTYPVNVTGVLGQFDNSTPFTDGYQVLPRDPDDLDSGSTPGNTFADWIAGFDVGGLTGFNDDFDNDGLANALENILGSDPSVANQGLTAVSASAGNLVFRHTLAAEADIAVDLTFEYEWSVDLANWQASAASAGGTTVTFANPVVITPGVGGAPDLVEVTATVTGTPATKVFARLRVDQVVAAPL